MKIGVQIMSVLALLIVKTQCGLAAQAVDYYSTPSFLTSQVPPLVMLVMGKNHKLFYEAYNDASDLNEDGVLDVGYKGEDEPYIDTNTNNRWDIGESFTDSNGDGRWTPGIDYYGYFDSFKCYNYSSNTFVPVAAPKVGGAASKKCVGGNDAYWSGDFLNYVTTSRMDALRKVLYGGYRSTDTGTSTVLQRAYIPQDAHSWGKEYASIANDGFDIREYTPLSLPVAGFRHLFANTTLSNNGTPLLRVLNDSMYRIIEWVSIERPVAGDRCLNGGTGPLCTGSSNWEIAPGSVFSGLTQTTYNITGSAGIPLSHAAFDALVAGYATTVKKFNAGPATNINGSGNPFGADDYYMSIFDGKINIPADNTYEFAVDGDDAVEVIIDGVVVASWYGGHGKCDCQSHSGSVYLTAGEHDIVFRHVEWTGGDNYYLYWKSTPSSTMTDYTVRTEVCNSALPENNCTAYPNGNSKPTGLLQKYGEDEKMYFGLLSGSYAKNMSGGVLRKNVSSIKDEIDNASGAIVAPVNGGIIDTLNKIRIAQFDYGNNYTYPGGWVTTRPMNDGEFRDWGNPIGEMMYETIRYFAGKATPTPAYDYVSAGSLDTALGLPKPAWVSPYDTFESCASPYMLVLSDIFPTFDSDQLPGVHSPPFGAGLAADDFSTGNNSTDIMDVSALSHAISIGEGINGNYYIGQKDTEYDGSCSPKLVDDFGEIRGMCPEEPTKQGSYYAAAVAYYGAKYDINAAADGAQRVSTFAVGLASPLPKINIDVPDGIGGTKRVTLVPFAKSVSGSGIDSAKGKYQPTNTITDFYVKEITPTYGKFEVNFEDVEQGADHDMDAVVVYEYKVTAAGKIEITLESTYAAGGIQQRIGYIISGTDDDGVYLEVRDIDPTPGPDYFLDTPPGESPGGNWADNVAMPLKTTRIFTPGATGAAGLLENPLYYAAKWGGFQDRDTKDEDTNNNGLLDAGEDLNGNGKIDYLTDPVPNLAAEWDRDGNGQPDSYFYVVNPLKLEEEIGRSFAEMLRRASSGTAASVISNSRSGEGALYQSVFYPEYEDAGGLAVQWAGLVQSFLVDDHGNMRVDMYKDHTGAIVTDTFRGVHQLNTRNEDLNYNGIRDTVLIDEDANLNGKLDPGEDLNLNGFLNRSLDETLYDFDSDGQLDYRDLIIVFQDGTVSLWDDSNENNMRDVEDEITFTPDIPGWHNNNILDTEDTNGNGQLDAGEDFNSNGILDTEDINGNGTLDTELVATGYSPDELPHLWNSKDWLDSFIFDPLLQRTYDSVSDQRYIFTFVDSNNDMIADSTEVFDFVATAVPPVADLTDTSSMFSYLTLHPTYGDKPAWVSNIEFEGNKEIFWQQQAKRVVDFVRGKDQPALTIGSYAVPAMRSRQYTETGSGLTKTWRLGDIVSSSPTLVGRPPENYHLLYRDNSYAYFLSRYLNRRSVVFAGGNDGMIHAFNAGFYDSSTKTFLQAIAEPYIDANNNGAHDAGEKYSDLNLDKMWNDATQTPYALGSELWAYVPFNLLPHLYWLTEETYPHVYYNDLNPKIFDAKIFPFNPADPLADPDHPYGWGTVMVVGMRFGGGHIIADTNRDGIVDATDRTMTSAYVIFDISNPEVAPKVLAEITLPKQGYTTVYPAVVPMRSKTVSGGTTTFPDNDWYLIFGSGPADANGIAASLDAPGVVSTSGTIGEPLILSSGISLQKGKLFVVDLKAITDSVSKKVKIIDELGASVEVTPSVTSAFIQEFNELSFMSQPVSVDFDLDFNADVVYFGSVSWDSGTNAWGGKMRRLITADSTNTVDWVSDITVAGVTVDRADNALLDLTPGGMNGLSQPISSAINASVGRRLFFDIDNNGKSDDFDRERWVFFGTGRFIVGTDAIDSSQQSFYGIKEPYAGAPNYGFTWEEVGVSSLLNSTNIDVYDDKTLDNYPGGTNWDDMISDMGVWGVYKGWHLEFLETNERNISQAALLGSILTFTTYLPSTDTCLAEGTSNLYATWYQTGTAYYKQILKPPAINWIDRPTGPTTGSTGVTDKGEMRMTNTTTIGPGMASSANIITGRGDGASAAIQTSTGDVIIIKEGEGTRNKSGKTSWLQQR
jgi:type IV pilus assembly protein PilY1